MHLPENMRDSLKKPMGFLLREEEATKVKILESIPLGARVITVGDATTEKMLNLGLEPSLQIVDSLEKRHKRALPEGKVKTTINCINPPAEITDESIGAIKKALQETGPVRILVKGEEDLLVLPVVFYAPDNSVVLYGQPNEGLVIVTVNQKTRDAARNIMSSMT